MRRGPSAGSARNAATDLTMIDKARAAWGDPLPDWIEELASLADSRGLRGAAKKIGYSPSTLSTVISNSYAGDMSRVEGKVRGALMGFEVECPVLGAVGRDVCLDHQKRPFAATNATRTRLFHACRGGCPNARKVKESDHAE